MEEEWRANREVKTCNIGDGEMLQLTRFPDSIVPMVPSGSFYSRQKKYKCGADTIDGHCACNSHGTKAFGYKCYQKEGSDKDIWLCAIDEHRLGLRPEELDALNPVNNSRENPLILHLGDDRAIPLCGGCQDFAVELMLNEHVLVTNRTPPTQEEVEQHCQDIWYQRFIGIKRGAKFIGFDGNFRRVKRALMSMRASRDVIEFYERVEGRQIYFIIPALYLKSILPNNEHNSFKGHCDAKYKGKPPNRSNWTWNECGKVMRFQNRRTGLYIDIACAHGTIVEQDWYASGCDDSHEMEHSVFHANGTATITFDHGRFGERDEVDLLAAFEEFEKELDSDDDDEEGGD